MNFTMIALVALLILCAAEIFIGIKKRSTVLTVIGVVCALALILALILAVQYSDAMYISDPGVVL